MQVGLFAYHRNHQRKGLRPYADRSAQWADARTTLVRAMWKFYRSDKSKRHDVYDANTDVRTTVQTDLLALEDFLVALEHTHGREARLIAENLVVPNDVVTNYLYEVARDKRVKWNGPKAHHPVIAMALGITPEAWERAMQHIREFSREWFKVL